MVLVPAGPFEMGSQDGEANESPVHVVSLDDFYIDTYEVTNELFARFLNEMGNQEQGGATWLEVDRPEVRIHQVSGIWQADAGFSDHPVVKVTWNGARAFCEWRGASLPTEAQWEKAARGGLEGALYPWGDETPLCQRGAPNGAKFDDDAGCNDTDTEPVGSYNPNGYGLFDMAGNAWEWVSDWYADNYYAESPAGNPTGPASGVVHVIRGGSAYDAVHHLRVARRVSDNPDDRLALIGFRCVRSDSTLTHTPQPPLDTPQTISTPTPTETISLEIGSTWVSPVDDMVMIYVPEGEFSMGSADSNPDAGYDEKPQHRVYLEAFWIDQTEVTNAMFAAFLNAQGNLEEGGAKWMDTDNEEALIILSDGEWEPKANFEDHPVTLVTRYGARAYCDWAGRRLPTEAEWEKAARGSDLRIYPWGDDFDCSKGNFDDESVIDDYIVPGGLGCDGFDRTSPVGSFPAGASPYGALDMAGNAWEWVSDWYAEDYYERSPYRDPQGPTSGDCYVKRGGSWKNDDLESSTAYRNCDGPLAVLNINGFRCSRSP
jgi:formylglycine-generating enzyme required for sulfatase activity